MSTTPDLIPPDDSFIGYFARTSAKHTSAHPVGFMCQAIAVMSVAFGPLVRFPWGKSPGYSHVWVMQIGESAQAKKSTLGAASIEALRQLGDLGVDYVLHDTVRPSDAGLAADLDRSTTDDEGDVLLPTLPAGQFIYFDELTSLMGDGSGRNVPQSVEAARALLTKIHGGWLSSTTRSTPVPRQPVSVTMVGNMVVEQFERLMSSSANVTSGFLGRWVPIRIPRSDTWYHRPPAIDHDAQVADDRVLHAWLRAFAGMATNQRATGDALHGWDMLPRGSDADAAHGEWYRTFASTEAALGNVPQAARPLVASMRDRWAQSSLSLAAFSAISRVHHEAVPLSSVVIDERDVRWSHAVIEAADEYVRELLEDAPTDSKTARIEGRIMRRLYKQAAETNGARRPDPLPAWQVTRAGKDESAVVAPVLEKLVKAGNVTLDGSGYTITMEVAARMEGNGGHWPV